MNFLRSDRNSLSRHDRRGRMGNGMYLDEMEISPRAPVYVSSPMDVRTMNRILQPQFLDEDIPQHQQQVVQRPVRERQRSNNHMPFGIAMKKLYKQIMAAEGFYGEFQTQYDADVQGCQSYATQDILTTLWKSKVTGDRGQSRDNQHESPERSSVKFWGMQRRMMQALEIAVESQVGECVGSLKRNSKMDSAKRLQKKVETASDQIFELLDKATLAREYCEALLSELDLLKTLINPDNEKNRGLYRGSDEEEDGDIKNEGENFFSNANANANEQQFGGFEQQSGGTF